MPDEIARVRSSCREQACAKLVTSLAIAVLIAFLFRPTGKDYDQLTKILAARDADRTLGTTDEVIDVRHWEISVWGIDSDQIPSACTGLR